MKFSYLTTALFIISMQPIFAQTKDSTRHYAIEDVVVKSYRLDVMLKNAPGKIEVIGAQQIARTPAFDIADIIKKNTSCESVNIQGLTAGFDFRGFAPAGMGVNRYSAMLLDGMPMGTMNAATTMMSGIGSIEVLKGPFSSLYGSGAMGGVVNIISVQSRGKIGGSALVGFGSFNTSQANASVGGNITKRLDFDLSIEYLNQNNSYKTGNKNILHTSDCEKVILDPESYGKTYGNTAYDKNGALLRVGYDLSKHWRINIYNNFYYTQSARGNGSFWATDGMTDKGVFRNYHRADLTYVNGKHSVRFSPYYSRESADVDYVSSWGNSREKRIYSTYGFQLQDVIKLPFASLVVGIDNFSQRNKSIRKDADNNRVGPWNPDFLDMQSAIFAQMSVDMFDSRLTSVVGVRYDNTLFRTFKTPYMDVERSSKSYHSINPTVALKYKIVRGLNMHASIGRAFLAPQAYQIVGEYIAGNNSYYGNNQLKPETAFTIDAGVGYNTRAGEFSADVTLFSTKHKNLIGNLMLEEAKYTFINSDRASMQGFEAMFAVDFGRMSRKNYSLKLFANYTRIFKSEVLKDNVKSDRLYVGRTTAIFGVEYMYKRFSMRVNGRYSGDKLNENFYDSEYSSVRPSLVGTKILEMPDFMVFDIFADYRLLRHMTVGVKCVNLLDENYVERDGFHMSGRSFYGQVSFRF